MSVSRGRGGGRAAGPTARWATGPVWSPTHSAPGGRWGPGREEGRRVPRPSWAGGGSTEEREGTVVPSSHRPPLRVDTLAAPGVAPSSLGHTLASSVSLPLELIEGLTCPDSSAGGLQRMVVMAALGGPSWVLYPLRPGDGSEVRPRAACPTSLGGLPGRRVSLV